MAIRGRPTVQIELSDEETETLQPVRCVEHGDRDRVDRYSQDAHVEGFRGVSRWFDSGSYRRLS